VVSSAHAVVLASGTLAPLAALQQQLFPGLPPARLRHFSCGHVVRCGPLHPCKSVLGTLCMLTVCKRNIPEEGNLFVKKIRTQH
jgi:hypothetical protein